MKTTYDGRKCIASADTAKPEEVARGLVRAARVRGKDSLTQAERNNLLDSLLPSIDEGKLIFVE